MAKKENTRFGTPLAALSGAPAELAARLATFLPFLLAKKEVASLLLALRAILGGFGQPPGLLLTLLRGLVSGGGGGRKQGAARDRCRQRSLAAT